MKRYVRSIARFFGSSRVALSLLTDLEYAALAREATENYYDEIKIYKTKLSVYERMIIANEV